MNKKSLSKKELKQYAQNSDAFYGLDLSRVSTLFIAQIYQMEINRTINIFSLTDEIKYLEGLRKVTSTGKPKVFRGEILQGLYKKHFMDASFIIKNIINHLGFKSDKISRLDEIISEAFKRNDSSFVDKEFVNYLSHHAITGAFEERAKKGLTGEWIIFQKYKEKNYYLTIAAHNEGDENILSRVRDVYSFDYPFLKR